VRREPPLASYFGLQGEENRVKLAEIFKQPTNWSDYCALADSGCLNDDGVATRKPNSAKEGGSYFVEGEYTGYFKSNGCDTNPNCIGSVVSPYCKWSAYTEAQLYWNNIALASHGPSGNNRAYGYSHMLQIYEAANATGADVFFTWWEPDVLPNKYARSRDFSFHRVAFPNPSIECNKYRISNEVNRCSADFDDRVGREDTSSCDSELMTLRKLLSNGFLTSTESMPITTRSPAFEFMKSLIVPPYSIEGIFDTWEDLRAESTVSNVEREGVCKFVYENLDQLLSNTPKGYPREVRDILYNGLSSGGYIMGCITLVVTIVVATLVYKWRNIQVIKLARVDVLYFVILGMLVHRFKCSIPVTFAVTKHFFVILLYKGHGFIAIAALTSAVAKPTDATCTSTQWL